MSAISLIDGAVNLRQGLITTANDETIQGGYHWNRGRPMQRSILVALCLFVVTLAPVCSTAAVSVVTAFKSGKNIRVGLVVGGKPRKGVKVDIYRYTLAAGRDEKPRFSLISDDDGWILPPKLASGHYHLVASADANLSATLYLEVADESSKTPITFLMELRPNVLPTRAERITEMEQMPVRDCLKQFLGVVEDVSGAVVPGTSIEIMRRGTEGKVRLANLKSDKNGKFHKNLGEGAYIAIFSMPGFQVAYIPFSITKQCLGELKVTLKLAQST